MKNLTELLGTNHMQTSLYHPQSSELAERFNATFHPQLAKLYNAELNDWDEYFEPGIYAYNTGVQSTTGYSSFQLTFGRNPVLPLDHTANTFQFHKPNDYLKKLMKCMNVYRTATNYQIRLHQQQMKTLFDRNRMNSNYQVNDLVLWKVPSYRGKLQERFSGPFVVVQTQHPLYLIQNPKSKFFIIKESACQ